MSFYGDHHVLKGRCVKRCEGCGSQIEIGQPGWTIPDTTLDCSIFLCDECYDKLEDAGIEETEDLQIILYNYIDEDELSLTDAIYKLKKEKEKEEAEDVEEIC